VRSLAPATLVRFTRPSGSVGKRRCRCRFRRPSPRRLRSGSSGLPRSLLDLRRRRQALEVFRSAPRRCRSEEPQAREPSWSSLLSRVLLFRPGPDGPPLLGSVGRARARTPFAPPPTSPPCVHSRRASRLGFGDEGAIPRRPVPPSWFRTTSAASSARKFAGLLHPAASPGVRRVSSPTPTPLRHPKVASRTRSPRLPATPFRTPRRIPLDRSRTASPQPLPPWRCSVASVRARRLAVASDAPHTDLRAGTRLRGLAPQPSP
jgi:hypothetical protein